MNIQKINDAFSTSVQVLPEQMQEISDMGFRALICNRPDNEDAGQPSFETIQTAAIAAGLEIRHIPIGRGAGPDDVASFAQALTEMPGPILGYCRSGGRSAAIYKAATS